MTNILCVCIVCRGFDCSLDKYCKECESWSEDFMCKYLKHQKPLEIKSRSRKAKKPSDGKSDPGSHSTFGEPSANATGPASSSSAGVSEDRMFEIVNSQFAQLSSSFAASMEASSANIQSLIELQ